MYRLRKTITPQGHEGCQGGIGYRYQILVNEMQKLIDKDKREWLADTGEDESEYGAYED